MRGRMREIPFSNTGKSLQSVRIVSFAPAFLISQKSQIFDSFPPGEAFYKSEFERIFMTPFEMNFTLPRERYDEQGILKPSAMLYMCQVAAGEQCKLLSLDWDTLQKRNLFWAVIRVRSQICRLPQFEETVRVVTWPMVTTRSAFPRTTEGYDKEGNLLFRVTNLWVLVDTVKRGMLLPGRSGVELDGIELGRELPLPGSIYPEELPNRTPRRVQQEDIDRNGHVNNTRYIDWMTELLGEAAPQLKDLHVVYHNEALLGDELVLCWEKTQDKMALEILRSKADQPEKIDRIFAARAEF